MAAGLVDVSVAMDAEVELLAAHYQAHVQVGQEHVAVSSEAVEGDGEQAVVAAGVAAHDGRVAVCARLTRADNLALKGIGQVNQLVFVEL